MNVLGRRNPCRDSSWSLILLAFLLPFGCTDPHGTVFRDYTFRTVNLSVAGREDPRPYLPSLTASLMLPLHEGLPLAELDEALGLDPSDLKVELLRLEELGLVGPGPQGYRPAFFVANQGEYRNASFHARETGGLLAQEVLDRWPLLEEVFGQMALSTGHSLQDLGFSLVGGQILDSGVLGALMANGALPAPSLRRPSPERSGGRYYMWAFEVDQNPIEQYAVRSMDLPGGTWRVVTFGRIPEHDDPIRPGKALERRVRELSRLRQDGTVLFFSQALGVPLLTQRDSRLWRQVADSLSRKLLTGLLEKGPDFPRLFSDFLSADYAESAFADFMIWYHRLALATAIQELADKKHFTIPREGSQSVIFHSDGRETLPTIF